MGVDLAISQGSRLASGLSLILLGVLLVVLRTSGMVGEPGPSLGYAVPWSMERAEAWTGPITGPIRLEGSLSSDAAISMPDTGEQVLRGWLIIRLKGTDPATGKPKRSRTLYSWEEVAKPILLKEGSHAVTIGDSALSLPFFHDDDHQSRILYESGKPVKATYGALSFDIEAEKWADVELSLDVERAYLPMGLPVTIHGWLESRDGIPTLTSMPGHAMQVLTQSDQPPPEDERQLGAGLFLAGLVITLAGIGVLRGLYRGSLRLEPPEGPTAPSE